MSFTIASHVTHSPNSMLEAINVWWEGAGTYEVGFDCVNLDNEDETEFYAESPQDLADLVEKFFVENNINEPDNPYWNMWDGLTYAYKVSDKNI